MSRIAVKERPILLSGQAVQAVLDGRKTQHRTVVKPKPVSDKDKSYGELWSWKGLREGFTGLRTKEVCSSYGLVSIATCPYGKPGDRLWVQETWGLEAGGSWYEVSYRANDATKLIEPVSETEDAMLCRSYDTQQGDWRASTQMSRWASRILLEVISVRVERLQDITEADAQAEGVEMAGPVWDAQDEAEHEQDPSYTPGVMTYQQGFFQVWDERNAKKGHSVETNPFVWVVEFKRIEP